MTLLPNNLLVDSTAGFTCDFGSPNFYFPSLLSPAGVYPSHVPPHVNSRSSCLFQSKQPTSTDPPYSKQLSPRGIGQPQRSIKRCSRYGTLPLSQLTLSTHLCKHEPRSKGLCNALCSQHKALRTQNIHLTATHAVHGRIPTMLPSCQGNTWARQGNNHDKEMNCQW